MSLINLRCFREISRLAGYCFVIGVFALGVVPSVTLSICAAESTLPFQVITCEGDYPQHLQGVAGDRDGRIYWSFTTQLVQTDSQGKLLKRIDVANHHGDLSWVDGRLYVAVNLGKFNQPAGQENSWVYEYEAETLRELARHPVPELVHGAGGIGYHDGHFVVVGGLPAGTPQNYLYEYDRSFHFVRRHVLESGPTDKGIQTANFFAGEWWLGCYGTPKILLSANDDFTYRTRSEFDCSLGLLVLNEQQCLVAVDKGTKNKAHRGSLVPAALNSAGVLVRVEAKGEKSSD